MKTLLLIRHAKAEPPAAGIVDHDRTLAERGRRDAPEMGRRLELLNLKPNLMISSTAARAAATARLIGDELGLPAKGIKEDSRLYASSVTKMLYLIQELDDNLDSVALVGHNPEMTELAQHFAPRLPDMATCAVARLDFDIASWSEIHVGVPSRVVFDSPKKGQD